MLDREDFKALRATGFKSTILDQCRFGAETAKPTELFASWIDFADLACTCNHPKQWIWWPKSGGGKWILSPHPLKVGCKSDDGQDWATKEQQAYPDEFNAALAERIAKAAWTIHRMRDGTARLFAREAVAAKRKQQQSEAPSALPAPPAPPPAPVPPAPPAPPTPMFTSGSAKHSNIGTPVAGTWPNQIAL